MKLAPICLFTFKRLSHTEKTIKSLKENPQAKNSDLFIFCDKEKKPEDKASVTQVKTYLKNLNGFKSITIVERDENFGLSKNIISGVTQILREHDRVIVLEDDMIVSPFFLDYMNNALEKYQESENVISIHGYIYPVKNHLPETFFLKGADCWGWATWKRGWELFEIDGAVLLNQLKTKNLTHEFDFYGSYPYTKMLEEQVEGKVDSWAIRWYASGFLKNKLTLYPGESLVQNIGLDGSGTNCDNNLSLISNISSKKISFYPSPPSENLEAKKIFKNYFNSLKKPRWKKIFDMVKARA